MFHNNIKEIIIIKIFINKKNINLKKEKFKVIFLNFIINIYVTYIYFVLKIMAKVIYVIITILNYKDIYIKYNIFLNFKI